VYGSGIADIEGTAIAQISLKVSYFVFWR